jgi:hypothetical protein
MLVGSRVSCELQGLVTGAGGRSHQCDRFGAQARGAIIRCSLSTWEVATQGVTVAMVFGRQHFCIIKNKRIPCLS